MRRQPESSRKKKTKDLALDFSLIKVQKPIPNPEKLQFLKVRMRGIEKSLITQDHRQEVVADDTGSDGFYVIVRTEDLKNVRQDGKSAPISNDSPPSDEDLADTISIQASHPEMLNQANQIVGKNDTTKEQMTKLVRWTANNIAKKMEDSFRPFKSLAVLRSKTGDCESHATLYAALARSQRIPTRLVTGLVYVEKTGFLYHAWAESYDNGWLAVDPTFNQVPADATHIKVATGDSTDNAQAVLTMVGKLKMQVLEYHH
jgi:transglutaminase-like putative cysteine protease